MDLDPRGLDAEAVLFLQKRDWRKSGSASATHGSFAVKKLKHDTAYRYHLRCSVSYSDLTRSLLFVDALVQRTNAVSPEASRTQRSFVQRKVSRIVSFHSAVHDRGALSVPQPGGVSAADIKYDVSLLHLHQLPFLFLSFTAEDFTSH